VQGQGEPKIGGVTLQAPDLFLALLLLIGRRARAAGQQVRALLYSQNNAPPNPSLHWTRLRRAGTGRLDSQSIGFTILLDSRRRASELNRWAGVASILSGLRINERRIQRSHHLY